MDLRDRLDRLRAAGLIRPAAELLDRTGAPARSAALPPQALRSAGDAARSALTSLGGEELENDLGRCLVIETAFPASARRGMVEVASARDLDQGLWSLLLPQAGEGGPATDLAYLDLETTGLAGGTGTLAFLIGVGRFEAHRFVVRQYFLRDADEEPAALHDLVRHLQSFRGLVTFNGRRFDWPLLETRLIINLRRRQALGFPHLDLLPVARRVYGSILESCSLRSLEASLLGLERLDDVPGALIPALFFRYLETGDASPLEPVLEHNRQDILSMAALLGFFGRLATDPVEAARSPEELVAVARHLQQVGQRDAAQRCLEAALDRFGPGDASPEPWFAQAVALLARLHRQAGRHALARQAWERLAPHSPEALVELAKHDEHRAGDIERARALTLSALALLRERALRYGWLEPGLAGSRHVAAEAALRHRLARLERKLARRSGQAEA